MKNNLSIFFSLFINNRACKMNTIIASQIFFGFNSNYQYLYVLIIIRMTLDKSGLGPFSLFHAVCAEYWLVVTHKTCLHLRNSIYHSFFNHFSHISIQIALSFCTLNLVIETVYCMYCSKCLKKHKTQIHAWWLIWMTSSYLTT